jgi:gas vesicle protein
MRNEEGGSSALLSFLLGGIVGAAAAILLAPKSGRETRQDIKDFAEDVKCRVQNYAGGMKDRLASGVQRGKDMVSERTGLIKSAVEAGKEAYHKEKERLARGDGETEMGESTSEEIS